MAAPAAEVIPRRSSSGVFLGLSFRAMMCVIAGVGVAVFATPVFGGFRGLAITAPVWLPPRVLREVRGAPSTGCRSACRT